MDQLPWLDGALKEVAKRTLTMEEIRKIPGTQGDALKVVQIYLAWPEFLSEEVA